MTWTHRTLKKKFSFVFPPTSISPSSLHLPMFSFPIPLSPLVEYTLGYKTPTLENTVSIYVTQVTKPLVTNCSKCLAKTIKEYPWNHTQNHTTLCWAHGGAPHYLAFLYWTILFLRTIILELQMYTRHGLEIQWWEGEFPPVKATV